MKQLNYERTLVILGLCLGPLAERRFSQSLQMSHYHLAMFFDRPIPQVCWAVLVVVLVGQAWYSRMKKIHPALEVPASGSVSGGSGENGAI